MWQSQDDAGSPPASSRQRGVALLQGNKLHNGCQRTAACLTDAWGAALTVCAAPLPHHHLLGFTQQLHHARQLHAKYTSCRTHSNLCMPPPRSLGASVRDSDSEEDWSDGGYGFDGGASVGAWDDGEVEVSLEDERAMAAFMVRTNNHAGCVSRKIHSTVCRAAGVLHLMSCHGNGRAQLCWVLAAGLGDSRHGRDVDDPSAPASGLSVSGHARRQPFLRASADTQLAAHCAAGAGGSRAGAALARGHHHGQDPGAAGGVWAAASVRVSRRLHLERPLSIGQGFV